MTINHRKGPVLRATRSSPVEAAIGPFRASRGTAALTPGDPSRLRLRICQRSAPWLFSWSLRPMRQPATGMYQLDGIPDLASKDDTMRDDMDGRVSTSNS
jgi:hypothetical protein